MKFLINFLELILKGGGNPLSKLCPTENIGGIHVLGVFFAEKSIGDRENLWKPVKKFEKLKKPFFYKAHFQVGGYRRVMTR